MGGEWGGCIQDKCMWWAVLISWCWYTTRQMPPRSLGHSSRSIPTSPVLQVALNLLFSQPPSSLPTPTLDLGFSVRECEYPTSALHHRVRGFLFVKLSAELTGSSRSWSRSSIHPIDQPSPPAHRCHILHIVGSNYLSIFERNFNTA